METEGDRGAASPMEGNGHSPYLIEGERVAVGPLRRDLLPVLARWNNDVRISRTTAGIPPLSLEQVAALYERAVATEGMAIFMIYDRASGRPIGTTYLEEINLRNRTAAYGIAMQRSSLEHRLCLLVAAWCYGTRHEGQSRVPNRKVAGSIGDATSGGKESTGQALVRCKLGGKRGEVAYPIVKSPLRARRAHG